MSGWFSSRLARKFFRQKLALGALAIVLAYLALAAIVELGVVSLGDATEVVGLPHVPGFFRVASPDKRLEDIERMLEKVDVVLKKGDTERMLPNVAFGKLGVAARPPDELRPLVAEAWKRYEALSVEENLDARPELRTQLDELDALVAEIYPPPAGADGFTWRMQLLLGTDRQGRSIFYRAIYSTKVAIEVGVVTSLVAVLIGSLLGAAAGFFGGWVDYVVIWLYTTLSSIPGIVLLVLLAYVFAGDTFAPALRLFPLLPVYVAFIATFWIGPCRVMRGETLKLKELEYVQAATAIGFGRLRIMLRHILPNAAHLMLINFSLLFIGAIKSEVILSYLGLGVKGEPSWGIMISQSGWEVVDGFFWQIGAATAFMFGLVLAFNILSDALQDVFDPKHV